MRKKGLSEVMVWAVMRLHDGAKIRVRVGSAYSEEFEVKVGLDQKSVLCCCGYPTPSNRWGHGGRPWSPRSQATPQGLDHRL